ncbi:probable COX15-cytochrome oxidase assembly factor [Serendipita indica DSM 11827]|uniref:Probable COX15-cytochrome oxidase assembly factor n=1 Tax=Serendipita indica (strain DSM 11827) TaxID=1109443 RepID=G4TKG2_SERID|nr:probable COX15-cytochrome oxidase assembly factor [Serendipita indica DSM 11827]
MFARYGPLARLRTFGSISCKNGRVQSSSRAFSTLFKRPTSAAMIKPREFPHFTPSYPHFFYPSTFRIRPVTFTTSSTTQGSVADASLDSLPPNGVVRWLMLCCGLTFGVIVVGAVTRLTESGLSITEWKPVTGVIPPIGNEAWQAEFDKYRQTPEFKILNSKMNVDEFKSIYYMEWGHRILGRVIGLAFAVPYGYYLFKRRLPAPLAGNLGALGLLLGAQGALGWYMVKSGLDHQTLVENTPNPAQGIVPRVSQYRLAAHLGTALLFFSGALRTALTVRKDLQWASGGAVNGVGDQFVSLLQDPRVRRFKGASIALLLLAFGTAVSGAFVAGLDAGLIYNEFPYMGEGLVPPHNELLSPAYSRRSDQGDLWWRNMLENPVTAQFDHRVLAMSTYFGTTGLYAVTRLTSLSSILPPLTRHLIGASFAMVNIQAALGITTLLYLVPVHLAATHQAGSVFLLTTLIALVTSLRRPSKLASLVRAARQRAAPKVKPS